MKLYALVGVAFLLGACDTATKDVDLEKEFADRCASYGLQPDTADFNACVDNERQKRLGPPPGGALHLVFFLARRVETPPLVLDLVVVLVRVVDLARQAEGRGGEPTDGRLDLIGGNDLVALRSDQVDLRVQHFLLCIEDVQNGAEADLLLL